MNYLLTSGKATIENDTIRFLANPVESDEKTPQKSFSTVSIDTYFSSGTIEALFLIKSKDDQLKIVIGKQAVARVQIGLNVKEYAYGMIGLTGAKYKLQILAGKGPDINPEVEKYYSIKISYTGSRFKFYVDGVLIGESDFNISSSQIEFVHHGANEAEIKNITIKYKKPKAFVIMQFSEEYTSLYKEVIAPICQKFGYEVIRGDDMYTTGLIIDDISNIIRESSLVIADISANNLNVYYEVGFSHAINKPTILLKNNNNEKLPFDISGFRYITYDNSIAGKPIVEELLKKHLESIHN